MPDRPKHRQSATRLLSWTVAIVAVSTTIWLLNSRAESDPEQLLKTAKAAYQASKYADAAATARQLLQVSPANAEALWLAAQAELRQQHYEAAATLLRQMPSDHRQFHAALTTVARMHSDKLLSIRREVEAWTQVLSHFPDDTTALQRLAQLYAATGSRSEALPLILRLVRLQTPSDLLMVAARETGSISDRPFLLQAQQADAADPFPPTGLAQLAFLEGDYSQAVQLSRQALQFKADHLPALRILGSSLLALSSWSDLRAWQKTAAKFSSDPEIQAVAGILAARSGQYQTATRQLLTAMRQRGDQRGVIWQLSQLSSQAGEYQMAAQFSELLERDRLLKEAQDRVFFGGEAADITAVLSLADAFQACGRIHEAVGWTELALLNHSDQSLLQARIEQLYPLLDAASVRLVQDTEVLLEAERLLMNHALLVDSPEDESRTIDLGEHHQSSLRFTEIAREIGLEFEFLNGTHSTPTRHMHELTGGGIGILDIDADSWPDVIMTQGAVVSATDRDFAGEHQIFRNLRGQYYERVTSATGLIGFEYGQGAAVGDLNEDGFDDFVVAGIGGATLWLSNGDGTFTAMSQLIPRNLPWFTSVAIADLNEDQAADILLLGYLQGPGLLTRLCESGQEQPRMCSPSVFAAEPDVLLSSDGRGGFLDISSTLPSTTGKGLGLLVADFNNAPGLEVLIASDTTPNSLLIYNPELQNWSDVGFASGIALSSTGKPEGSMGIAVRDLNADQIPDVVVTNFLAESAGIYESVGAAQYIDRRDATGLAAATRAVLGFGAQFLDADLDGSPELFLTNGHIDNLNSSEIPYQMPSQMFTWNNRTFREQPLGDTCPWMAELHLGRSVARLDWNQDGRPDLLIGTLYEPAALLSNETPPAGISVAVSLTGISSPRTPIGAGVMHQPADNTASAPEILAAGDGYQSSNQKQLLITAKKGGFSGTLSVLWPDGSSDEYSDLLPDQRYRLIQNSDRAYRIPE